MLKRYCSYCGAEMIERDVPAEKAKEEHCTFGGCFRWSMGTAFNTRTGKRQYVKELVCPKYKKRIFPSSPHDQYYYDKVFTK